MREGIKSILRPLYHFYLSVRNRGRARKILQDYAEHHREAQQAYRADGHIPSLSVSSPKDVRVRRIDPQGGESFIELSENYRALTDRISHDVETKLGYVRNCWFFPKLKVPPAHDKVTDLEAVRNGEVIAVQLKDYLGVEGLNELCAHLIPEIEKKVYGSYVLVDKVYVYRNLVSHVKEQVSWTWHYDNHPVEVLKVMIYLTDVSESNGPFEYLRSSRTMEGIYRNPTPLSGYGRVSSREVQGYLAEGAESQKVTGPRGTLLFFDDNVVHKANVAQSGYRDVIVLQLRPCTLRQRSFISSSHTGSFEHVDFNQDPWQYAPISKRIMVSG
jgi:hypothetical protein